MRRAHQGHPTAKPLQALRKPQMTAKLKMETEAYQALLEGHRRDPDDDELYEDLQKAKAAMETAWLEAKVSA